MAEKDLVGSPAPERVVCPVCRENGSDSEVELLSESQTNMQYLPFIGQGGKQHIHDENIFSKRYRCSGGHEWKERSSGKCWCGWKGEVFGKTTIIRKQ